MSCYLANELWTQILFQADGESVRAASCVSTQLADVGGYVARSRRAELEEEFDELEVAFKDTLERADQLATRLSTMTKMEIEDWKGSLSWLEEAAATVRSEWPAQEIKPVYSGCLAEREPHNEGWLTKAIQAGRMIDAARALGKLFDLVHVANCAPVLIDIWYDMCLEYSEDKVGYFDEPRNVAAFTNAADKLMLVDEGLRSVLEDFSWGFNPKSDGILERSKEYSMDSVEQAKNRCIDVLSDRLRRKIDQMFEIVEAFETEYF